MAVTRGAGGGGCTFVGKLGKAGVAGRVVGKEGEAARDSLWRNLIGWSYMESEDQQVELGQKYRNVNGIVMSCNRA